MTTITTLSNDLKEKPLVPLVEQAKPCLFPNRPSGRQLSAGILKQIRDHY